VTVMKSIPSIAPMLMPAIATVDRLELDAEAATMEVDVGTDVVEKGVDTGIACVVEVVDKAEMGVDRGLGKREDGVITNVTLITEGTKDVVPNVPKSDMASADVERRGSGRKLGL
jgi:hypothetical protein